MDLHIPTWLVCTIFYVVGGAVSLALLIASVVAISVGLVTLMRDRNVWWSAKTWLTTRQNRENAEKYSVRVFATVAENLKRENPGFYARIAEVFREVDAGREP